MGAILKTAAKWGVGFFLAEQAVGIISKETGKKIGAALPYIATGVAIYAYVKAKK